MKSLYDSSLSGLEKGSNKITRTYMTGFLRDYLVYVFVFFIVIIGGSLVVTGDKEDKNIDEIIAKKPGHIRSCNLVGAFFKPRQRAVVQFVERQFFREEAVDLPPF